MIYVVVFSQNYASSTWCLDELTKILNCKKRYGRVVIPVFYKVDPSIVRHQRETYAEEFVKYKHRFADNIDKVHAWKAALTEAAEIAGWDSQKTSPEATLVAEIVKDILTKLNSSSSCDHQEFVGIETHITQIKLLMKLETLDIRIIGIWGLGGIGKTTIAGQIYHQLASQFCSSSLVLNVPEEIERHGIQRTRSNYEKELVEGGISISSERLKRTKVLLFLDDVNDSGQLRDLIGGRGRFGQGSRIILTSRDMQVLKNAEADEIYEVKEMNDEESLKLFSIHAFHQNQPIETYKELSEKVLRYAKGIPLALQILGSLLYRKTEEVWKNQLQKLEKYPDSKIFNVLKLSYDGLDEEQKNIFLDIACFYRGYWEIFVAQQLESCGFSATIGMDVLKDKCLISILKGNVQMHDLIQEMGREIVRQECCLNPGKRSRLWKVEEIHQVLKNNEV
ncbi:TMV resistance protein N [Glycine soja]|uniref:TMV resistance protein N n=1 Tax=Glycine soja TaxID=3848 RepID=A0A0B2PQF8_GLYSO|nr:TMV resistance protein N [Glycine soja]